MVLTFPPEGLFYLPGSRSPPDGNENQNQDTEGANSMIRIEHGLGNMPSTLDLRRGASAPGGTLVS